MKQAQGKPTSPATAGPTNTCESACDTASLAPTTGGEDWLEVSLWIKWGKEGSKDLYLIGQAAEKARVAAKPAYRTVGGRNVRVQPGPKVIGRRAKARYLQWHLSVDGVEFAMSAAKPTAGPVSAKGPPNAVVIVDGRSCLARGAWACWTTIIGFIGYLGGHLVRDTLSRVDLCLDMPGQSIAPFVTACVEGRYVTRAKLRPMRGIKGVTLAFGRHPWQARIYDKLAEIKNKNSETKQLMVDRRWGGTLPSAATRVEFQLGRVALKGRGVDSVADYFDRRADLAHYLSNAWLRFTATVPSKGNEAKAKVLPLWTCVRKGFGAWAGAPAGVKLQPVALPAFDAGSLMRSAIGLVLKVAAEQGQQLVTDADLITYVAKQTSAYLPDDWQSRFAAKKSEVAHALAALPALAAKPKRVAVLKKAGWKHAESPSYKQLADDDAVSPTGPPQPEAK